jgi:hypothetical protein
MISLLVHALRLACAVGSLIAYQCKQPISDTFLSHSLLLRKYILLCYICLTSFLFRSPSSNLQLACLTFLHKSQQYLYIRTRLVSIPSWVSYKYQRNCSTDVHKIIPWSHWLLARVFPYLRFHRSPNRLIRADIQFQQTLEWNFTVLQIVGGQICLPMLLLTYLLLGSNNTKGDRTLRRGPVVISFVITWIISSICYSLL